MEILDPSKLVGDIVPQPGTHVFVISSRVEGRILSHMYVGNQQGISIGGAGDHPEIEGRHNFTLVIPKKHGEDWNLESVNEGQFVVKRIQQLRLILKRRREIGSRIFDLHGRLRVEGVYDQPLVPLWRNNGLKGSWRTLVALLKFKDSSANLLFELKSLEGRG